MCSHVYITCVHAAAEGCIWSVNVNVSIVTGAPVKLYAFGLQSAALEQI